MGTVVTLNPRTNIAAPDRPESPAAIGRSVYTVKEVARMLRLNLGGTYKLIRDGEIPAIKLGGRWTIPKRRFDAWLNNESTAATPAAPPVHELRRLVELSPEERNLIERFRRGA